MSTGGNLITVEMPSRYFNFLQYNLENRTTSGTKEIFPISEVVPFVSKEITKKNVHWGWEKWSYFWGWSYSWGGPNVRFHCKWLQFGAKMHNDQVMIRCYDLYISRDRSTYWQSTLSWLFLLLCFPYLHCLNTFFPQTLGLLKFSINVAFSWF